jgi:hypothetical protein
MYGKPTQHASRYPPDMRLVYVAVVVLDGFLKAQCIENRICNSDLENPKQHTDKFAVRTSNVRYSVES